MLDAHFDHREPAVRAIYDRIVRAARQFGEVREEPKKTSIHLVNRTAFAGVMTRKDALILTIKADRDIKSARVVKRQQTSANRWHHDVRLTDPREVDQELRAWLRAAYELSA